jgi:hypothetical protein
MIGAENWSGVRHEDVLLGMPAVLLELETCHFCQYPNPFAHIYCESRGCREICTRSLACCCSQKGHSG